MFPNDVILEYLNGAANGVEGSSPMAEVHVAEAASQAREQRLAAERALDAVLADSFPASDPPPWTLGVSLSCKD